MVSISSREPASQLVNNSKQRIWFSIITWSITLIACICLSMFLGCSETQVTEPTETVQNQTADTAPPSRKEQLRQQLVGVWLGGAFFDEVALKQRVAQLPPEEAQDVVSSAQFFAGTVMAIDFRENGTLENDIEIVSPNGEKVRGRRNGYLADHAGRR